MHKEESVIIGDAPCPSCRSQGRDKTGNHLILFSNGNKFCNRCGYSEVGEHKDEAVNTETIEEVSKLPIVELTDRKISKDIAEFYGVRVAYDGIGELEAHYYPIYKNKELTGYKKRLVKDKKFYSIGDVKESQLFGQQLFNEGGMLLVITEGECDAMAAFQMLKEQGKNYRVVSLVNGANTSSVKINLEWIESFKTIILALDQDEPGKKAAKDIAELFTPGKAKIMSYSEKDPNDMLKAGKSKEFLQSLMNANMFRPDGIVSGKETWDIIKNKPRVESIPYPQDWEVLNQKAYGIRLGELDTWTSGSGMGKSQLLRELQYHLFNKSEHNVGVISLEEPLTDSVEALMALHLNKRIMLPDVRNTVSEEEMYKAWESTVGTNRFHFYDHFGSVDDDSLINKIRYMARGLDCKYIFLDHLSIVVSEFADQGGERERIDTIMTRLKNLTQELGIWIGLIVHLRKTTVGGKSFEEGAVPSLDDLRGSGAIKQLSNNVYALSRNQQHSNELIRNTSRLHVLKCRLTGRTGDADYLYFNDKTGRIEKSDYDGEPKDSVEEF